MNLRVTKEDYTDYKLLHDYVLAIPDGAGEALTAWLTKQKEEEIVMEGGILRGKYSYILGSHTYMRILYYQP